MKTTKQHFEYFKTRCHYYQNLLNLLDYRIYFEHKNLNGQYANINYNTIERVVKINLTTNFGEHRPVNKEELNKSAKHEITHLLLAELCMLAKQRYVSEIEIDKVEEGLVRVIERLI